ncbi:PadR family transcriptional regulator [Chloroflexus sp.]|uniref:PadR family transcriptional regulator n=1 Tax=Chloroflexus sp. TaxID=1904827 RepID=UPI002623F84E|nr:PadR family transcriptional regulator [uncultured Chloroflexus sp.]
MSLPKQSLTIELALLGLLRQQPMHPYELFRQMQQRDGLGSIWRLKQSHLYALLDRLEAEGYLSHHFESQGNRPWRKVLSVTAQGETVFIAWLTTPVFHGRDIRLEFLAKLYFARREGSALTAQLLERQIDSCRQWLRDTHTRMTSLPADSVEQMVLSYRFGQLQATLAWLESCRQALVEVSENS